MDVGISYNSHVITSVNNSLTSQLYGIRPESRLLNNLMRLNHLIDKASKWQFLAILRGTLIQDSVECGF